MIYDLNHTRKNTHDLQVGKAGEYLVCADLIINGHVAFLAEQGLPYDIVLDVGKLKKVQVKTTITYKSVPQRKEYSPAYLFQVRRCGKGGRNEYNVEDTDIIAFVALKEKLIWYMRSEDVGITMHFRSKKFFYSGFKVGRYLEDYTLSRCLDFEYWSPAAINLEEEENNLLTVISTLL